MSSPINPKLLKILKKNHNKTFELCDNIKKSVPRLEVESALTEDAPLALAPPALHVLPQVAVLPAHEGAVHIIAGPGVRGLITPESSLSGNTAWSRKPDECGKQDRTKFIPDFV